MSTPILFVVSSIFLFPSPSSLLFFIGRTCHKNIITLLFVPTDLWRTPFVCDLSPSSLASFYWFVFFLYSLQRRKHLSAYWFYTIVHCLTTFLKPWESSVISCCRPPCEINRPPREIVSIVKRKSARGFQQSSQPINFKLRTNSSHEVSIHRNSWYAKKVI